MRKLALLFLALTIVTGTIGFTTSHANYNEVSQVFCYIFLVAFLVTVVADFLRGGTPR